MKGVLLEHAITPIQQYSYTVGKNLQILPLLTLWTYCILIKSMDFVSFPVILTLRD
jgi:hypothetical protein